MAEPHTSAAAGTAFVGAGAIMIVIGLPLGGHTLLVGLAVRWLTDRRRPDHQRA